MKKIMFSDKYSLTQAVLEGRKTMTRRIVPEKLLEKYYDYDDFVLAVAPSGIPYTRAYEEEFFLRRSPFKVGEVVAVAQCYNTILNEHKGYDDIPIWANVVANRDNGCPGDDNKMFVRADLMPHQIRITSVRVERLQDISDEDCLREGITTKTEGKYEPGNGYGWDTSIDALKRDSFFTPKAAFAALIDKVSGKGTWESNPYCFCYEFELIK